MIRAKCMKPVYVATEKGKDINKWKDMQGFRWGSNMIRSVFIKLSRAGFQLLLMEEQPGQINPPTDEN